MLNNFYPSVSAEFFISEVLKSKKVDPSTYLNIGTTHTIHLKGKKPLHKKLIVFREFDGEINFMQATGLALILGFMTNLLTWFETYKKWKDGGYFK